MIAMVTAVNEAENVIPISAKNSIGAEASEWVVVMQNGDASPEMQAAFAAWYNKSDKNREAYDERATLWRDFDAVELLGDIAESNQSRQLLREDVRLARWGTIGRRAAMAGIAASFALLIGLAQFSDIIPAPWREQNTYETLVGEQKTVKLADGSTVNLNTDSKMKVAFSHGARNITLERGEAYFEVYPDKARPFSVHAGERVVRAVGTAFAVRRLGEEKVSVTVTKGRVALFSGEDRSTESLDQEGATPEPLAELDAGSRAVFDKAVEEVEAVEPEKIATKLAWRGGVLAFSGEKLSTVVDEMGRYTGMKIDIASPEYADMTISGYMKIGAYEDMFEALELMAGLKVARVSRDHVVLTNADEG